MACNGHLVTVSAIACSLASIGDFRLVLLRISISGADTTTSIMARQWWPLAMIVYPETQARAHEELDAVVGRARLPTFAD